MGPDNAQLAGPWQLLAWPRQTPLAGWVQDVRVHHLATDSLAIELVDGPWACADCHFRDDGLWLDLTLIHVESGRTASGTFDMEDGVWAPADGSGHMTVAEFHRAYAGVASTVVIWPADPFKDKRAPSELNARSGDGEFLIDLTTNQWRMSDWICPPRILHVPSGDCLLDLKTTYWDARATFRDNRNAELRLRAYPAAGYSLVLELYLDRERYRLTQGSHPGLAESGQLDDLQRVLGRSAKDLEELGVAIDVRASRREPVPAPAGASEAVAFSATPRESQIDRMNRELAGLQDRRAEPEPGPAAFETGMAEEELPLSFEFPGRGTRASSGPGGASGWKVESASPRGGRGDHTTAEKDRSFDAAGPAEAPSYGPVARPGESVLPVTNEPEFRPAPATCRVTPKTNTTEPALKPVDAEAAMPAVPEAEPAAASAPVEVGPAAPGPATDAARVLGIIDELNAEISRRRLNVPLHYEAIVLGVVRAVAAGTTSAADAVTILETLMKQRAPFAPGGPATGRG